MNICIYLQSLFILAMKKEVIIYREKNLLMSRRALEIYVNDEFVDYIEPKELEKKFILDENANSLQIKDGRKSSNIVNLSKSHFNHSKLKISVTTQVQNGLFIFIYICFFASCLLGFLKINPYLSIALALPMSIIAYWQMIGRKKYFRLTFMN